MEGNKQFVQKKFNLEIKICSKGKILFRFKSFVFELADFFLIFFAFKLKAWEKCPTWT